MENTKLNERRYGLRYPLKQTVEIILDDGRRWTVEAINISRFGLQFRCDGWIASKIEPRGIQNYPLDHINLSVTADLPMPNENRLHAKCEVVVARRLSQEEFLIGLRFTDFHDESDTVLARFIDLLKNSA